MYSLFLRRRYDVCALTDKDVSVTVNSEKLGIKTFDRYVDLYLGDDETVHVLAYRPETIVALALDFLLVKGIYRKFVERLFEFER
jgi:hypothetical protein